MISESIIKCINDLDESFNRKGLLNLMDSSGFEFKEAQLKRSVGLTSIDCVYLDVYKLTTYFSDREIFFILLHETAHLKRIKKFGKDKIINSLSLEDFDLFVDHIVGEEIIADRYGRYLFWLLNKVKYPIYLTQGLELAEKKLEYRERCKPLFGVIKNSEENYKELIKTLKYD